VKHLGLILPVYLPSQISHSIYDTQSKLNHYATYTNLVTLQKPKLLTWFLGFMSIPVTSPIHGHISLHSFHMPCYSTAQFIKILKHTCVYFYILHYYMISLQAYEIQETNKFLSIIEFVFISFLLYLSFCSVHTSNDRQNVFLYVSVRTNL